MRKLAIALTGLASIVAAALYFARPSLADGASLTELHSAEGIERLWQPKGGIKKAPAFFESYQHFLRQRTNQKGLVDYSAYDRAIAARDAMVIFQSPEDLGRLGPAADWQYEGPENLDVPYRQYYGTQRATSGRVTAIAYSPADTKVIYVGSAGGGVFRTSDGGASWAALSDSDSWPGLQVSSIAVDPMTASTVYAGTGGARGFFRLYGHGIMKSTDAGATWTNLNSFNGGPLTGAVSDLAVDPDNRQILYATVSGRNADGNPLPGAVYRSTNGGATFSKAAGLPDGVWNDVSIGIKGPNTKTSRAIYVSGYGAPGKCLVYRSLNSGVGWTKVTPPAFTDVTTAGASPNATYANVHVEASKVNFGIVYALSGHDRLVYRSTNQGATWTSISANFINGPLPPPAEPQIPYNWSQSFYDVHLTTSYVPGGGKEILYAGLITLQASDDNGQNWFDIGRSYLDEPVGGPLNRLHNDQHALGVNPRNPNEVLVGCDGGLYKITYSPKAVAGAARWGNVAFSAQDGLNIAQFYDIALVPNNPNIILGGTQDNASPRSYGAVSPHDGLAASKGVRWNNSGGGDGGTSSIDPTDKNIMYVSSTGTTWRSTDGWATSLVSPNANTYPLAIPLRSGAPNNESTLFLGPSDLDSGGSHLFLATNGWLYRYAKGTAADNLGFRLDRKRIVPGAFPPDLSEVSYRLGPAGGTPEASGTLLSGIPNVVRVAPGDGNIVYVGTLSGKLYMTKNAKDPDVTKVVFTEIQDGAIGLPANLPITSLEVHPYDPTQVYVGLGGTGTGEAHLLWCDNVLDPDREWLMVGDAGFLAMDIPVNSVVLDRNSPDTRVYVANDLGVFGSTNGGTTFAKMSAKGSLWNVQVNSLKVGSGWLSAGTFGRGVHRITTSGASSIWALGASPNTTTQGQPVQLRVVLSSPAPTGGAKVTLSIDDGSLASLPADVTIPEGQIEALVEFTTLTSAGSGRITASYGGSRSTPLRVSP